MATFKDNADRTWTVEINVDAIKRVRSLCELDLLNTNHPGTLERLATDPVLLCDAIFAVCKPQADKQGVSDEEFGRAMAGDAIEQATEAFLEELARFFPTRRRELMTRALQKLRALDEKLLDAAEARLESGELEKMLESDLTAGKSSTSSPGSSESTQDL